MKCGIKYEGNWVSSNPWRRIKKGDLEALEKELIKEKKGMP